jgi:hypothetical protein
MFNRIQLASYCAQYAFNLDVSNEAVWVDGIPFDSVETASELIQTVSDFLPKWLAAPDADDCVVDVDADVEELLPEVRIDTFDLQPLVENVPEHALVFVNLTGESNAVNATLLTPRRRVTVPLEGVSVATQAALRSGNCEVELRNKALIISYVP